MKLTTFALGQLSLSQAQSRWRKPPDWVGMDQSWLLQWVRMWLRR